MLLVEREAVGCAVWRLLGGVHIDLEEGGGSGGKVGTKLKVGYPRGSA